MSVTVTGNPLIVPAADVGSTAILSRMVHINSVVWDSGSSGVAGDTLSLKDKDGNVKLTATLSVAKSAPQWFLDVDSHGIIVDTLTHGTLYIYLRK